MSALSCEFSRRFSIFQEQQQHKLRAIFREFSTIQEQPQLDAFCKQQKTRMQWHLIDVTAMKPSLIDYNAKLEKLDNASKSTTSQLSIIQDEIANLQKNSPYVGVSTVPVVSAPAPGHYSEDTEMHISGIPSETILDPCETLQRLPRIRAVATGCCDSQVAPV